MSLKSEYMLDIDSMSKLVLTEVHWLFKKNKSDFLEIFLSPIPI